MYLMVLCLDKNVPSKLGKRKKVGPSWLTKPRGTMGTESRAVIDVFRCIDHIEKRRHEQRNDRSQSAPLDDSGRHKRRSQAADDKLRERYYDVLQGRDVKSTPSERIKTLRRMVLAQGLPEHAELLCGTKLSRDQSDSGEGEMGGDSASAKISADPGADVAEDSGPPDESCSLRGLVWKVLLGTIHIDAALYVSLVARGPSAEDVKIREDTFRTFQGDAEFRRRVHEDKLSRINNAFVRLNSPVVTTGAGEGSGAAGAGGSDATGNDGNKDGEDGSSATGSSKAGKGGVGAGCGKGLYVQGMMVLCAPLLFVMPEVDAFFAFNSLLNDHMPRYVAANLDGVHAGCALVDRALSAVDPALFNYLESKFVTANIYAFPLLMSLHACVPPLEETIKLWDAMFSFGVHLEVLICVAQCVSLRETLLQDPNPYQHVNYRNLPPLDAELLVAMAFSLIPHLPPGLMDEIARHPFLDEEKPGEGRE